MQIQCEQCGGVAEIPEHAIGARNLCEFCGSVLPSGLEENVAPLLTPHGQASQGTAPGTEPPPSPPPYGAGPIPAAPHDRSMESSIRTRAIITLVLGALGFCCCITTIPAIILGHLTLADINRYQVGKDNRALIIIGLVLGYLGVVWGMFSIFISLVTA